MDKKTYEIGVHGCDDSSCFEVELTSDEFELVKSICDKCTETSTCFCMPTMDIEEKLERTQKAVSLKTT